MENNYSIPIKFTLGQKVSISPIETSGTIVGVTKLMYDETRYWVRWYNDRDVVEQYYYEWEIHL